MGDNKITNATNRAKTWQISFFAMNNTATNVATTMMGYYAFFTQNVLMLSAVVVGTFRKQPGKQHKKNTEANS